MKELHKGMTYEAFGAEIDAETSRRDADAKCWMILDLGDGDVAVLAWFGTPAKMAKLRGQLEALPQVDCAWLWRNASAEKMHEALHALNTREVKAKPKKPKRRRATSKKARR